MFVQNIRVHVSYNLKIAIFVKIGPAEFSPKLSRAHMFLDFENDNFRQYSPQKSRSKNLGARDFQVRAARSAKKKNSIIQDWYSKIYNALYLCKFFKVMN